MAFATAGSVTLPRDDFERLLDLAQNPPVRAPQGVVGFDAEGCGPYVEGGMFGPPWTHALTHDDERLLTRCRDVLR